MIVENNKYYETSVSNKDRIYNATINFNNFSLNKKGVKELRQLSKLFNIKYVEDMHNLIIIFTSRNIEVQLYTRTLYILFLEKLYDITLNNHKEFKTREEAREYEIKNMLKEFKN